MSLDQRIALFSAIVGFLTLVVSAGGFAVVIIRLKDAARQRETESLIKILDVNRELITLAFSHPELQGVLADAKNVDPHWEQYYLQLWWNHLSLQHWFFQNSWLKGELSANLPRDASGFMKMHNMRRHWHKFGDIYPLSFQHHVNAILKKAEPHEAAQRDAI